MLIQDQFETEEGVLKAYLGPGPVVVVPEGIHTIGEGVFKGMAWILEIQLPASLKVIGASAFKGCRKLRKINIPDGVVIVGEYAFHRCHDLEELIFPKSVTTVGSHAFLYCDHLKKVVLESPIRLGKAVFSHDLSLEEISLNRDLDDSNFSDEVFEGCVRLKTITLSGETYEIKNLIEAMDYDSPYPGIIRSIAVSVYHSMQIEDGVIGSFNINLKSITLPEGIRTIGKGCFFDKRGIVSITFPESLRRIRANAFLNCTGLEEVTISSPELTLDDKAFRGCCNLKRVHFEGKTYNLENETANETVTRIRDQVLGDFYISGQILLRYNGEEEQVKIPGEVKIIGERCFFGNERVKTVICPPDLLEIREQAFAGCLTLQNIILSDTLKRVEAEAFAECKKLLKCNLPSSVEYIGEYAFRRCFSLMPFDPWPQNAYIDPYAFYRAGHFDGVMGEKGTSGTGTCENDTGSENKPGTEVLSDNSKAQPDKDVHNDGCTGQSVIKMRSGGSNEQSDKEVASYAYANKAGIEILTLSGVKRIGKYAYAGCPDLKKVIIDAPECVIEEEAFSNCPNLKCVELNVCSLGERAFAYCRKLEEVHMSGVAKLPAMSFAGCYMLKIFEAKDLEMIGARCFDECTGLGSFDLSEIATIGERAFERCDSLKNIKLGKISCKYHAFADCAGLESVEISEETVLGSGVFKGCTQVSNIVLNGKRYEFSRFEDCLNHAGNPYPQRVREVIASVFSCFEIRDRKVLTGYSSDAVSVTIPGDMEEIGQDVFRDHVRLCNISIPASVRIFGSHAFSHTTWLEEQRKNSGMVIINDILLDGTMCRGRVVIPSGIKRVAGWCFAGNSDITELVILSETTVIEALSFRNCLRLKKITDPDGKEYVLENVSDLKQAGYPELIGQIFSECINCFKLDEEQNLIESTGNLKELVFPDGIKSIGEGVYKDCHLLESITLSKDTGAIGRSAFENSKWLKCVKNTGAVTEIGAMAFSGCQSLESFDPADDLENMGNRCFEHCVSLREIKLSERLAAIPERAFFRCKSLRRVTIPRSVRKIGAEAFAFCDGLEEVHVCAGTQIAPEAFAFCDRVHIFTYE